MAVVPHSRAHMGVDWGRDRQAHRSVPKCAHRAQQVQCSTPQAFREPQEGGDLCWLSLLAFSLTGEGNLRHCEWALAAEVEELGTP